MPVVSHLEIDDEASSLAQVLLRERGETASRYAADKTLEMLDKGWVKSAVHWTQISLAINQLERKAPTNSHRERQGAVLNPSARKCD